MSIIESNEESMMPGLLEFFSVPCHFDVLLDFVNNRARGSHLSIGLLDWFNVNYAPKNNVEYIVRRGDTDKVIFVWQAYNAALSGYGKALFDPFARGSKIGHTVTVTNGKENIVTTLCQLNYFRWAIKNGVIDYVKRHVDEIYDDMLERSNRGGKRKGAGRKQKLTVSSSKTLGKHHIKMTVKFNINGAGTGT